MKEIIILFIYFSFSLYAQNKDGTETKLEKEVEQVDFDKLKEILIKDKIYENAKKKEQAVKKIKKKRKKIIKQDSFFPKEPDFWEIASEHWLVKNAPLLKWDFEKPIYGIGIELKKILLQLGYVEKKVKIIYTKNSIVPHFALPTGKEKYLLVLSVPFIKTMNLNKKEIAMLLLEDIVRSDKKLFQKNIKHQKVFSQFGQNMNKDQKKEFMNNYRKLVDDYSELVMKRGYTFQQQFEITRSLDKLLKPTPSYWNAYYQLCVKRDLLTKSNHAYKNYSNVYPSPTMQLSWLRPKDQKVFH